MSMEFYEPMNISFDMCDSHQRLFTAEHKKGSEHERQGVFNLLLILF